MTNTLKDLLPPEYGFVLVVDAFLVLVGFWLGGRVMGFRRKYFATPEFEKAAKDLLEEHKKAFPNAKFALGYPDMGNGRYSEKLPYDQWYNFNNAQRGHYNFLEQAWGVSGLLLLGGLFHPITFASLGACYTVGRILYAIGYTSGSGPAGREAGAILAALSLLGMAFTTMYIGFQLARPALPF